MTEIPEHLLKRAAAARAAKGGGEAPAEAPATPAGGEAAPAAPAAAVEKAPAAPAPLPTLDDAPPKATPDIAVVAAAKRRKRVPFWAAPVLALLPLWAVIYVASVQPPPAGDTDPLVIGKEAYTANGCSGCHGADGGGGTGAKLGRRGAEDLADLLRRSTGSTTAPRTAAPAPDGTYGDLTCEGGAHNPSIPPRRDARLPRHGPRGDGSARHLHPRGPSPGGDRRRPELQRRAVRRGSPRRWPRLVEEVTALDPNDPDAVASVDGAEGA
ncbi:MAG: c-type cytochrome [Acidimicrobiales bacterium]